MAVWERATISAPAADGSFRVDTDAGGDSWVKFLSESFRKNDGNDYGYIGVGVVVIESDPQA